MKHVTVALAVLAAFVLPAPSLAADAATGAVEGVQARTQESVETQAESGAMEGLTEQERARVRNSLRKFDKQAERTDVPEAVKERTRLRIMTLAGNGMPPEDARMVMERAMVQCQDPSDVDAVAAATAKAGSAGARAGELAVLARETVRARAGKEGLVGAMNAMGELVRDGMDSRRARREVSASVRECVARGMKGERLSEGMVRATERIRTRNREKTGEGERATQARKGASNGSDGASEELREQIKREKRSGAQPAVPPTGSAPGGGRR